MIVRKIVGGRDVLQNCQQILPGFCKARREAGKDGGKKNVAYTDSNVRDNYKFAVL